MEGIAKAISALDRVDEAFRDSTLPLHGVLGIILWNQCICDAHWLLLVTRMMPTIRAGDLSDVVSRGRCIAVNGTIRQAVKADSMHRHLYLQEARRHPILQSRIVHAQGLRVYYRDTL